MRVLPICCPALVHRARQTCEEKIICQIEPAAAQPPYQSGLGALGRAATTKLPPGFSTVNLFTIANGQNQHQQDGIMNLINDPVISDAKAITILKAGQFLRPHAPGIFRQLVEGIIQPLLQFGVADFPQRLFHRRTDFQPVAAHAQPRRLRASAHATFSPGSDSA
jgi:hypothetical protein